MSAHGKDSAGAPLLLSVTLPVLGIPTRFETNSPAVMEVVVAAFGVWRSLDAAAVAAEHAEPAVVWIEEVAGDEGPEPHASLGYELPRSSLIVIRTPGSVGTADSAARRAFARVTSALVADREHFRYGMLEAMVLAIHTRHDREPLHAAALVRGGTVALLAGPVGVGKSTLCLAAAAEGMKLLAEDCVFLQRRPGLRIWGFPGHVHVRPDALTRVPDLPTSGTPLLASGEPKRAFRTADLGALPDCLHATRAVVCIIRRADGPGSMHALSPDAAAAALLDELEPGFDIFAATIGERVARLVEGGGWLLRLPASPSAGLALVHRAIDAFEAGGGG